MAPYGIVLQCAAKNMNLIQEYLHYVHDTEPPAIFHRWSFVSMVGALLERNVSYGDGHFTYFPNLYVMLMGESGSRKSTAINLSRKILEQTGYKYFSAEQTSKEKYLQDLDELHSAFEGDSGDITTAALFGNSAEFDSRVTPSYIVAGEFNNFIGNGNIEFMSILGDLWDWNGVPYSKRIKSGKSVSIPNPTISLLGGNTATGFSLAFPPSAIGQGFFSRLILIHSPPSGRRIRKPVFPPTGIVPELREVALRMRGSMKESRIADKILDAIYNETQPIDDSRFISYFGRRYAQLVKICMICAAVRMSMEISEDDVILANTMLAHAEMLMPKALGEFGKARSSDVAHTILNMIQNAHGLVTLEEIWSCVSQDLENNTQMADIISKLLQSRKIQTANIITPEGKKSGLLPIRRPMENADFKSDFIDLSLLTKEEREMTI